MTAEDISSLEDLLANIEASLLEKESNVNAPKLLDPTPLARSV